MTDNMAKIAASVRLRMAHLLEEDQPARETALLLADIEQEQERHERVVADLARRADELEHGTGTRPGGFLERPHPAGVDSRAAKPWKSEFPLTNEQIKRGVVFAYGNANPTFYRAVIDRLAPGERVRNVTTNHGAFEYTRDEFLATLPDIASSNSYTIGTTSAPGACRYTTGTPSPAMRKLQAPD